MDLAGRMQQLEEMVRDAKSMPLSSSALLNRDEVLEMLAEMQESLPEEIKQARWIVKDREELLAKARKSGEATLQKAQQERARLVSQEEVVRGAGEEAERILSEAREQARQIRLEAEDYVDAKLAQFEIVLGKTQKELSRSIGQVQRGREKLRGVSPAQEEFGGGDEEDEIEGEERG
jgi:cell division septum initiation protein DivIVA